LSILYSGNAKGQAAATGFGPRALPDRS